jgi:hypothetical protein
MPTIGQAARIAHRGRDVPDIRAGDVSASAAIAYEGVLGRASRQGRQRPADEQVSAAFARRGGSVPHGTDGYEWRGTLGSVLNDAWSEVAAGDKDEFTVLSRAVNEYLARTGNAVCLYREKRMGVPSTWWVRAAWSPVAPVSTGSTPRPAERRVTAAEAGEDREPAEVTTRWACTWTGCGHVAGSVAGLSRHHHDKHRSMRSYLKEALTWSGSPAPAAALHELTGLMGSPAGTGTVQAELTAMTEQGQARLIRQSYAPPGYRADSEIFPCSEPGCGQVLSDSSARTHHEMAQHPDSAARIYPCSCGERYYTYAGAHVHASRAGHATTRLLPCRENCGEVFSHHLARTWHEEHQHPDSVQRTDVCPRCAAAFYPSAGDLNRHRARLHGWTLTGVTVPAVPWKLGEPAVPGLSDRETGDFVTTVTEPARLPAAEVLREFLADYDRLQQSAAVTPAERAELTELRDEVQRLRQREATRRALAKEIAQKLGSDE